MISITTSGDSNKTTKALAKMLRGNIFSELDHYGERGVQALASATPVDTGLTAKSWNYRIVNERNGPRIEWFNTNDVNGTSVVVLIVYGHGTGTGGYVQGRNFVNPVVQPLFDDIVNEIWEKVRK